MPSCGSPVRRWEAGRPFSLCKPRDYNSRRGLAPPSSVLGRAAAEVVGGGGDGGDRRWRWYSLSQKPNIAQFSALPAFLRLSSCSLVFLCCAAIVNNWVCTEKQFPNLLSAVNSGRGFAPGPIFPDFGQTGRNFNFSLSIVSKIPI